MAGSPAHRRSLRASFQARGTCRWLWALAMLACTSLVQSLHPWARLAARFSAPLLEECVLWMGKRDKRTRRGKVSKEQQGCLHVTNALVPTMASTNVLSWEQIFKGTTGKVDNRSLGRILEIKSYSSHASRTKHSAQLCYHCQWSHIVGCKAILFWN